MIQIVIFLLVMIGVTLSFLLHQEGRKKTSIVFLLMLTLIVIFGIPEEYRSRDVSDIFEAKEVFYD